MSHAMQKTAHETTHAIEKTAHEITTTAGGYILGGLEIVGGVVAGGVGIATGNYGLIGIGLDGIATGVGSIESQSAANEEAAQTAANVGDFSNPQPVSTTAGTSGVGTVNAQNEAAIAQERYAESQTEIGEMSQRLDQTVLNEKTQELQAEGGIRASAAARGLKLEGSPMMQLIAQQSSGQQGISFTEQQGAASIMGARTGAQASLDAANLAAQEQLQYADQQLSNAWLESFTGALNLGASMIEKWPFGSSSASASLEPGGPISESGIDYYGY